ncbi:MAG: SufE family protein [archaeon]
MLDQLLTFQKEFDITYEENKIEALMIFGKNVINNPALRQSENKVPGCISETYIAADCIDGKMKYKGYSEELPIRGCVYILTQALSGLTPQEVIAAEPAITDFLKKTNITAHMFYMQANSFDNIYAFMKEKAKTYQQ